MQKSNAPIKLTVAFASGSGAGPVNTVPLTPGSTPGTASYQTGFTSVNMEPIASGGIPPFGADFNGIIKNATTAQIWQQAGYMWPFDSTFSGNANIGGYPSGAVLMMGSGNGLWISYADNNTKSPDATGSQGWIGLPAVGAYTIDTTGGTVVPDPSTLGVTTLIVTGALTSNAIIVLPLIAGSHWIIVNSTTGAYTLTAQGPSGAGVSITQGSALTVFTDGAAYYAASANLSGQYLPINGTAVAATKLATARNFSISGFATAAAVGFDGTGNVVFNVTALNVAGALGYTPANDASVVHVAGTETITGTKSFKSIVGVSVSSGDGIALSSTGYSNILGIGMGLSGPSDPTAYIINRSTTGSIAFYTNAGQCGTFNVNGTLTWNFAITAPSGAFSGTVTADTFSGNLSGGSVSATTGTFSGAVATAALTCTTFNATSSDRRLKRNIRKFKARPLHRSVPFVSYTLKSNGWHGLGSVAQEVQKIAPEHVGEFDQGGKQYLSLNYAGMAYEQAIWAGQEIDRLTKRIAKLERALDRAKIEPRKRGFARRLLEAIW
ncbi:MAG TPA: tail fiber domain-containing protein [Rhodanobacteraceae bacterium]|nr:tail fiber domain-containing protein [Rhodanobacteraceae bacterium]